MKKRVWELIMTCILAVCLLVLFREAAEVLRAKEQEKVIVVDAGHGGRDPGVVGINNIEEKNINLSIALKLRHYLEKAGYNVVLTRDDDYGLYEEEKSNKKMQDMNNRIALIRKTNPVLTISIHQNSFLDESVCGPQVFYKESSEEGREIAKNIQETLNDKINVKNPRKIKGNMSYYLLKEAKEPTVIVECGFLTNPSEANLLQDETYQTKIAEAITEGVFQYFESGKQKKEEEYAEE